MTSKIRRAAMGIIALSAAPVLFGNFANADEPIDLVIINRIMNEGFQNTEVMETLRYMTDEIGPRLTGSPQLRRANDWTLEKFTEWGLENGRVEGFDFGRGWTFEKVLVHMQEPRLRQMTAYPLSWTPGTDGVIEGEVIIAQMSKKEDLEKYKGQLEGKIVLLDKPRALSEPSNKVFTRRDEEWLKGAGKFIVPQPPTGDVGRFVKAMLFAKELYAFLAEEGAVAAVKNNRRDGGLLEAALYLHGAGDTVKIPAISLAAEDYNRISRLVDEEITVTISMDIDTTFYDDDHQSYNTIAEIPGRGRNPEIVMAGAHLDSWIIGDGAADNGAGSAVVMEAARILKALGVKPKRTIRFALWGGEEQGFFGSLDYIDRHVASRPTPDDDDEMAALPRFVWINNQWPITPKEDHGKISAYFNMDNGSGRFRGIYGEHNVATQPIFEAWFEPFHEMGAETVILGQTGGTDHRPFQAVGIPAYQFIQDPLDYGSRLHHTQVDTLDHIWPDDLKQASVIMATFLYNAAMRDDMMPRKPLPTESTASKERRAKEAEKKAEEEAKTAEEAEEADSES